MSDAAPPDLIARAEELREQLHYHSHRYYVLNAPVITDGEYDALYHELKQIEADYPALLTPDSPTQRAGAEPRSDLPKVRHVAPVLSLSNAFNPDDLVAWRDRLLRLLDREDDFEYTIEPKLDGLSVVLTYENGLFTLGATRGNGEIGEDVTPNLRTVYPLPLRIPVDGEGPPPPRRLVLRGEVFFRLHDFEALNAARAEAGEPD
ncbi:MAG: NAD-dependent DNA ligase LigA, partial [Chloroflexi bacterium]|nr:NAD-dependent DNA ligase LigA [Chloroflexota bacterium]